MFMVMLIIPLTIGYPNDDTISIRSLSDGIPREIRLLEVILDEAG